MFDGAFSSNVKPTVAEELMGMVNMVVLIIMTLDVVVVFVGRCTDGSYVYGS